MESVDSDRDHSPDTTGWAVISHRRSSSRGEREREGCTLCLHTHHQHTTLTHDHEQVFVLVSKLLMVSEWLLCNNYKWWSVVTWCGAECEMCAVPPASSYHISYILLHCPPLSILSSVLFSSPVEFHHQATLSQHVCLIMGQTMFLNFPLKPSTSNGRCDLSENLHCTYLVLQPSIFFTILKIAWNLENWSFRICFTLYTDLQIQFLYTLKMTSDISCLQLSS